MLPKNLVLDEVVSPKSFAELTDLVSTSYRTKHEQTTLESIRLRPDGTVHTPAGEWRLTQDFLESGAKAIEMPLPYMYKVSPELFCENFSQRQAEATVPVTSARIGDVATGLIVDRKWRYRPASTLDALRAIERAGSFELRRASVSFAGVDVELAVPGCAVEPIAGDVLEVGLALSNSDSGGRQLKASAYTYRLHCTNGAIMSDTLGFARWPNDPRMTYAGGLRAFEHGVADLCEKLEPVAALYLTTADKFVPDNELWNLWRRVAYLLSRSQADSIVGLSEAERLDLQQVIRNRSAVEPAVLTDRNAYEIHNQVTYAAHGRSFAIRRGLQEVGGDFLSRAASWPPSVSLN
jgi:hypothetical protein